MCFFGDHSLYPIQQDIKAVMFPNSAEVEGPQCDRIGVMQNSAHCLHMCPGSVNYMYTLYLPYFILRDFQTY